MIAVGHCGLDRPGAVGDAWRALGFLTSDPVLREGLFWCGCPYDSRSPYPGSRGTSSTATGSNTRYAECQRPFQPRRPTRIPTQSCGTQPPGVPKLIAPPQPPTLPTPTPGLVQERVPKRRPLRLGQRYCRHAPHHPQGHDRAKRSPARACRPRSSPLPRLLRSREVPGL